MNRFDGARNEVHTEHEAGVSSRVDKIQQELRGISSREKEAILDRDHSSIEQIKQEISKIQKKNMGADELIERMRGHKENNSVVKTEYVTRGGKVYQVDEVDRSQLGSGFGKAYVGTNHCEVRSDLTQRVKNFVREHELYHLQDPWKWGGWIGREIRANVVPGLKDPLGLAATISASLSPERLAYYWQRLREGR